VIIQVSFPDAIGSVFGRLESKDLDEVCIGAPVELVKPKKLGGPDDFVFRLKF